MSLKGILTNIQRCSTEDGPGIRTTVFFKGCPLSCIWCHNIETIDAVPQLVWHEGRCIADLSCIEACPEGALELTPSGMRIDREKCETCGSCEDACPTTAIEIIGKEWEVQPLVDELVRDKVFFDTSGGGVTLSGGEALYQLDFVIEVAKGLREKGVHVALDTCGYANRKSIEKILPLVDLVLYDLKQMDSDLHLEYTGVPVENVLSNAKILSSSGVPVWIRTPIIPGYTDSEDNIRAISRFILEHMANVLRYDLLSFNNLCIDKYALLGQEYPLKKAPLVAKQTMEALAEIARIEGVQNVHWSGMTLREEDAKSNTTVESEAG